MAIQNPKDEDVDGDGNVEHIYFVEGLPAGCQMYEYLVTIPPEQDMRSYGGTGYAPVSGT
jgi:flagellar hook protein FlgE